MNHTRTTLVAAAITAGLALSGCGANTPTAAPPIAPLSASTDTPTPTVDPTVTPPPSTPDTPPATTTTTTDTPTVDPTVTPPPSTPDTPPATTTTTDTPTVDPTAAPPTAGADTTTPAPATPAPPSTHTPAAPTVPVTHAPPADPPATPPPAAPQPAPNPAPAPIGTPAPAPSPVPAPPVAAALPRPAPVVQAPPPPPAPVVQVDGRSACQRALDARPGWTSGAMASGWGLSCVDRLSIPVGGFAEGATSSGRRIIEVRQGISYQDAAYTWAHESGHAYDMSVLTQAARAYVVSQVGGDWPRGMTSSGPYLLQVQEPWGDAFAACGGWGRSTLGYRQIPCGVVAHAEAIAQGR